MEPELIPVSGSQLNRRLSHQLGSNLPLLSARPVNLTTFLATINNALWPESSHNAWRLPGIIIQQ